MTLWTFDTSTRELVYNDPQHGPLRFSMGRIADFDASGDARALEAALRKALPRANNSNLIVNTALRLQ
jgi:hypothetical protein